MIDELKHNIQTELEMVRELSSFVQQNSQIMPEDRPMLNAMVNSLRERIKIINSSNAQLIRSVSLANPLPGKQGSTGIEVLQVKSQNQRVALRSKDKDRYLKELAISESLLKSFKKRTSIKLPPVEEYKKPNLYAQIANRLFLKQAEELIEKKYFENLNIDLRKGNINVLTTSYISMMILSTIISGFLGIFLFIAIMFFDVSSTAPFIQTYSGSFGARFLKFFWIIFAVPVFTFGAFYFYPYTERSSLSKRIDSELPFVVIHMGSISGSGVEPTQIFKIVGLSKEYPHTRGEIRKLLNQINVYGYDLITSLKNVARLTPSAKLAEVLNGLSTTISSGGDLKTFFEKRAESLLLNYRLEREKFTKVAETFMDIYISVVIATPMILLLLLVMISVSGVNVGLNLGQMTLLIILVVAVVNVLFLWVLTMRQPGY